MIEYFWAQAYPQDVAHLQALIKAPVSSAEELAKHLAAMHALIVADDLDKHEILAVRPAAHEILRAIFEFRMALLDQVEGWHEKGLVSHEAQANLRAILRDARYGADMMGELALGYHPLADGEQTLTGFTGDDSNTLVNPKFAGEIQSGNGSNGGISFRTGDVLLVRGQRHNSAAIARIGDVDSQFSHVGLIYIDRHGEPWVVEALIEVGATINPLSEALGHGLSRAVLLRHKDWQLAERAADIIHDRVQKSKKFYRRRIPYDFSMRLEGYRKLFCAKLIREAFDKATRGKYLLPTFKTRLDMKNRDFLNRIGVGTVETFAPADLEIEPDFDVVAEWRDYRATSDSRLQDLLMDKIFEWMEERDYRFKPDFTIRLVSLLGRLSSHLSEGAKEMIEDVVPTVPRNMPAKTIGAIAMLHQTAQPIFLALKLQERDSIQKSGRPLSEDEIRRRIEFFREFSPGKIGYLVSKSDSEKRMPGGGRLGMGGSS